MHTTFLRRGRLFHNLPSAEEEILKKGRIPGLYRKVLLVRNRRWAGCAAKEWGIIVSFLEKYSRLSLILRKSHVRLENICSKTLSILACLRATFSSPSGAAERCWDAMFPSRAGAFADGYCKYRIHRRELFENHGYTIFTVLAALITGVGLIML